MIEEAKKAHDSAFADARNETTGVCINEDHENSMATIRKLAQDECNTQLHKKTFERHWARSSRICDTESTTLRPVVVSTPQYSARMPLVAQISAKASHKLRYGLPAEYVECLHAHCVWRRRVSAFWVPSGKRDGKEYL
ncbi:hypothetical protein DENSPDRAFT_628344 [Dentipellis sp. KUC8613]|nr:hypothetical protein DENSPDRAFT_628344 [Dentipellis sp. KUC8613]